MTLEQIYQMIDELHDIGLQRLGFTGGEPLLYQDIGKVISHANSKGIMTSMVTNGSLVKNKIDEIKDLDLLLLSLDGPPEIHEYIRQQGMFSITLDAIRFALSSGKNVWTETVITKANVNHLNYIVDLAEHEGFKCLFQPVFHYPLSSEKKSIDALTPNCNEYQKAINNLIHRKKQGAPIVGSYRYLKYIRDKYPFTVYPSCKAGIAFCAISPSGIIAPCHFLIHSRNWKSGIEESNFKKAFYAIYDNTCNGCFCNSYIETNLLFALNFESTWNAFKMFFSLRR